MNILLQILDDGIITDSHGKQVDFTNTVIVMTTNAGSTYSHNRAGFSDSQKAVVEDKTRRALEEFLRPEFINRVEENFKSIADIMLSDLATVLDKKGIESEFTPAAREYIAKKSYSVKFGARNMRRLIQSEIEDKIAELIVAKRGQLDKITVDADENGITVK